VQLAAQRQLALPAILEPNDFAAAAVIALCHYYSQRIPQAADDQEAG